MKPNEARAAAIVDAITGPILDELVKLAARVAAIEAKQASNAEADLARTLGIADPSRTREVERVVERAVDDLLDLAYPEMS